MELLFINKSHVVYTEIYKLDGQELLCRYVKRDGTVVEFLVDDTPNLRKLLQESHIRTSVQHHRDYSGGFARTVERIRLNDKQLSKIAYAEYHGVEVTTNVFLLNSDVPIDYRKSNLTLSFKEYQYSDAVQANRKKFVERTLLTDTETRHRDRMNAEYSGKISAALSTAHRSRSILNEEIVAEIREDAKNGATQQELADMHGLSRTAIADIVTYRTWNTYEYKSADIAPVDVTALPQVPYVAYNDEPTKLHMDSTISLFACDGFVYKLQQKVDFQVYMSKHLPTGEFVSDVHLSYVNKPRGSNKYRNYMIAYVRGDRLADYYMSKDDVYSIIHSYMEYSR